MKDMMRFLVIMGIFLVGFSLTVSAIYVPVFEPPASLTQSSSSAASEQPGHNQFPPSQQLGISANNLPTLGLEFQSPLFTFEMLFYSLFGLVEPDFMPPMHSSPAFSKVIMKLVFGVYMMITVVVLINLLIAMMSNTYQRIEARSDIEWKFGRAKLIRNMIRTSPTPSPLILLMGVWIDLHRKWRRRQLARKRVEKMAVAAFNRKASISETATRAAHIWMSKTPKLAARRRQLGEQAAGRPPGAGLARLDSDSSPANKAQSRLQSRPLEQEAPGQPGQTPETAAVQGSRIREVVSWPSVVRKYWENVGVVVEREEELASEGQGAGATGSGQATPPEPDAAGEQ